MSNNQESHNFKRGRLNTIIVISPDTVPLPLKSSAPETITENNQTYSLRNKCCCVTGLGKRAWKIAEALAKEGSFRVILLIPNLNYPGKEHIDTESLLFEVEPYNFKAAAWAWSEELDRKLKGADFVIVQTAAGVAFKNCSVLPGKVNVIVDGFVPLFAELPCALLGNSSISRKVQWDSSINQYLSLLLRANCVLYANDRQYYYYEGQFFAINKLNWKAFKFSPLLKVPLGIDIVDKVKKVEDSPRLKLVWFGPAYPWYKPEKLLDVAMHLQNTDIDFIGVRHPRYMNTYNNFFKKFFDSNGNTYNVSITEDFWTADTASVYQNYDAGIILAREWLEEKYSIRGRALDMISHGLPVIINKNNALFNELDVADTLYPITSSTVRKDLSYFERDKNILRVSDESHKSIQKRFGWAVVLEPLIDYIKNFEHGVVSNDNENTEDAISE